VEVIFLVDTPWDIKKRIQEDVKEITEDVPPGKKEEAVSETIKKKTDAATPRGTGSIPLETGAVKLVETEPSSPLPEPEVIQSDVNLKYGQWVNVIWERPSGEQVSVSTPAQKLSKLQTSIQDEHHGRIIRASIVNTGHIFFQAPTRSKWEATLTSYYKQEYLKSGYIPLNVQKELAGKIPGSILGAGSIPSSTFIKESYAVGLGIKTETEASKAIEKSVFKHADIAWAEKYITEWDVPTTEKVEKLPWSKVKEIEPASYIKKIPSGFTVSYNPYRWQQERRRSGDFMTQLGGFTSWVFSPERTDYVYESLAGPGYQGEGPPPVFYESPEMKRLMASGEYEYYKAWRDKDYGKIATRVISSPTVSVPLTFTGFKALGIFSRTITGGKALVSTKPFTVTPTTAITGTVAGYGTIASYSSLSSAYELGGWDAVRREAGKMAISLPVHIGAAHYGFQAGVIASPKYQAIGKKIGDTLMKGYSEYTPKGIQTTFGIAKQKIIKPDPFFFQRQVGHIYKYLLPDYAKKVTLAYRQFPSKSAFTSSRSTYIKGAGYYGSQVYPKVLQNRFLDAVKHRLPYAGRDPGLYRPHELTHPYPVPFGYKTSSWIRPESISIMPKKVYTMPFRTQSGDIFFMQMAADKSFYSYGRIDMLSSKTSGRSLGVGKKGRSIYDMSKISSSGQKGYVYGKTVYTVYDEHPLIPNIYEKPFVGIIQSKVLPKNISADFSVSKSTSSFKTFIPSKTNPFAGFRGRLFGEEFFTTSTSVSKSVGGGIPKPGKYGFTTIELPDITYSVSKSLTTGKSSGYYIDKAIAIMEKAKTKDYFGSAGGFDTTGLSKFVQTPKLDLAMPGGIGPTLSKVEYPSTGVQYPGLSTRTITRFPFESGVVVSPYWMGVAPSQPRLDISLKPEIASLSDMKFDIMTKVKISSLQKTSLSLSPITMTQSIQSSKSNQAQIQSNVQQQMQMQTQIQSQMQTQLQQQLQKSQLVSVTTTQFTFPSQPMPIYPRPIPTTPTTTTPPRIPPPIPPPSMDYMIFNLPKKKKEKDIFGVGYRFRKWKTPKMEDLLKLK